MRDSEFPSWVFKGKDWNACTFQGLGPKKQVYLDLLTEGMVKKGFQHAGKIKLEDQWAAFLYKKSDSMFESPDEKIKISIQAIPKDGDLRVGFADTRLTKKKFRFLFAFSILLAWLFTAISAYIIARNININEQPDWGLLTIVIFILVFMVPPLLYIGIPARSWRQQVKQLLVETAEFMGGKQISPFKKTTVELED